MAVIAGLAGSLAHTENGMPEKDMRASLRVADRLDEVVIFRSTGPWSRRWIERGYPTKNFHVKGKSSDWGPQAGFVPYLGVYSKVGDDAEKAKKGTKANDAGFGEGFADKVQLALSMQEIMTQLHRPEEAPPRRAIVGMYPLEGTRKLLLIARRSGDQQQFGFVAEHDPTQNRYLISVYPRPWAGSIASMGTLQPEPLLVMTSSEAGAMNKPMTGDYDLMSVCPTWRAYMTRSTETISKQGLHFTRKGLQEGQTFATGSAMDKVLDMRMNTGAVGRNGRTYQGFTVGAHNTVVNRGGQTVGHLQEHGDMGNLTPRILRCINELNKEMNPDNPTTPFRRVHHNAESHRHAMFGALVEKDMVEKDDGFPMTGFHPRWVYESRGWAYGDVCTIEKMSEFRAYAEALHAVGFYVPRNWTWGMSIRDKYRNGFVANPRG
jgi:hypothetical protein